MGDVLIIDPSEETLRLVGVAERNVARLIDLMVKASRLILRARDQYEFMLQHEAFLDLQRKLSAAKAWLEIMDGVFESAHDQRQLLLSMIPTDKAVQITACNDEGEPVVVLTV